MQQLASIWLMVCMILLCGSASWGGDGDPVFADQPPASDAATLEDLSRIFAELDSDSFERRESAAQRLSELVMLPDASSIIAREAREHLVRADVSFEVQACLTELLEELPPETTVAEPLSREEIQELLHDLGSPDLPPRLAAAHRLALQLALPEQVCPIMVQLKQFLSNGHASSEARRIGTFLWDRARGAWVASDPDSWNLPEVTDEQSKAWVADVASIPDVEGPLDVRTQWAIRELEDLLIRKEHFSKTELAIAWQLNDQTLGARARQALQDLHDFSQPALVAEYWSGGQHQGIQHLLVDVPQFPQGARVASHFDQVNEHSVRCVSGNNLIAGETYPVGVAIVHPHPGYPEAFFHILNLPTPHRRMMYDYQVRRPQSVRLREISESTVDHLLKAKRRLTGKEIVLLSVLDFRAVSRFAGDYLKSVDDGPLFDLPITQLAVGDVSAHGMFCLLLGNKGGPDLLPVLIVCIKKDRIEEPASDSRYHTAWLAVLAIASRHNDPHVNQLLAGLVDQTEPLILGIGEQRDVGATAAAILLQRHGESPDEYDLESRPDEVLSRLGVAGYQFTSTEGRAAVHEWWKSRGEVAATED